MSACHRYRNQHSLTVMGYIRKIEQNNISLSVVQDMKNICLRYYALYDAFTISGDKIKVNAPRNIAQGTTDENILNTVYGKEIIDLTDDSIKEYRWMIQINEFDGVEEGIWIGLCDVNAKRGNIGRLSHFLSNRDWSIVWLRRAPIHQLTGYTAMVYITTSSKGMPRLHVTTLPMSYGKNIEFDHRNQQYNLGIVLSNKYQKVEILSYSTQSNTKGIKKDPDYAIITRTDVVKGYVKKACKILKNMR